MKYSLIERLLVAIMIITPGIGIGYFWGYCSCLRQLNESTSDAYHQGKIDGIKAAHEVVNKTLKGE